MTFRPIAVVGRACVLPGALAPDALWEALVAGQDLTSRAQAGRWRLDPARVLASDAAERAHHDRGGYVTGFEACFDPTGFRLPAERIQALDPLVRWTLHTAREALRQVKGAADRGRRTGAVLGNLSLPSESLSAYAERVTLESQGDAFLGVPAARAADAAGVPAVDPHNRFMSGYPALVLAEALGLEAGSFALDAACASSLYAIKLACDALADGRADLMLAGAVNRADDLFLHMGFTALQALSPSGRSRPFHREADGLLPAEGAAFVALKRLEDAIADDDRILGVIRGVGLANDGRATGLLVPDSEGQERALRAAYAQAGWLPETVGLVECHATGTPVGDATELHTLSRVFAGCRNVPLGSVKGNLGHPITVAGLAALLKVLGSFEHGVKPPNVPVDDPTPALRETPFRLLQAPEPWSAGPRRAAISAFGFGGNDAHLLVEAWDMESSTPPAGEPAAPRGAIAVVGMGALVGDGRDVADLAVALFGERAPGKRAGELTWSPRQLRFPPADLAASLPQQLWLLGAAEQALGGVKPVARERAGIYAGMQCDASIARYGVRWRVGEWLAAWTAAGLTGQFGDAWLTQARDAANPLLTAAGVVGTLPNVVANRLNSQFDFGGPGFSVSAEELSGIEALRLACRALRMGELDLALVGAVDLADEPVQAAAARAVLPKERWTPGDAAVVLTLKRLEDAKRDGDRVLAVLPDEDDAPAPTWTLALTEGEAGLTARFGHAHAASGLLHVAAAVLACRHRAHPRPEGAAEPLLVAEPPLVAVEVGALAGAHGRALVAPAPGVPAVPFLEAPAPRLHVYGGADRAAVARALAEDRRDQAGPARLVIVASDAAELAAKREKAAAWLAAPTTLLGDGIYFADAPIEGEVAAVFGGAASAYAGMGRGLLLALPELGEAVARGFGDLGQAAGWVYAGSEAAPGPLQKLWGSSLLSQAHAHLTRKLLGVPFTAAIGVSSGETNSLYAFGAWQDMGALRREFEQAEVFTKHLGGECEVLKAAWAGMGLAGYAWTSWRLAATPDEVRAVLEDVPFANLTMVLGPRDVVIGGHPDACRRAIAALDPGAAVPLGYDVAVHAAEVKGYAEAWHALHRRPTSPVPGVRFYTHATGGAYEPTADTAADALLGQAIKPIDFPALIETAYADGVRVFVEHGPQGGLAPLIRQILGDRPHLAVSLDLASVHPLRQLMNALGQLVAAGVAVEWRALEARWDEAWPRRVEIEGPKVKFNGHRAEIRFPQPPQAKEGASAALGGSQLMAPAPELPSVLADAPVAPRPLVAASVPVAMAPAPAPAQGATTRVAQAAPAALAPAAPARPAAGASGAPVMPAAPVVAAAPQAPAASPPAAPAARRQLPAHLNDMLAMQRRAHESYMALMAQQAQVHQQFLAQSAAALQAVVARKAGTPVARPATQLSPAPQLPPAPQRPPAPQAMPAAPSAAPQAEPAPRPEPVSTPVSKAPAPPAAAPARPTTPAADAPVGPTFDRQQLEVLASGAISSVFGPLFAQQDGYRRQVRMPEPPLLLADRVTGIRGEAGSMKTGTIWTETDVRWDSWYLHQGRMPAGIMVESGQADLLLISWLGADFLNKGERVYRLLGCQLTYHADPTTGYEVLPKPGDTLRYDIHVDGHARQGDIRLFFFHYDCRIDGSPRLTVRHGQAGFFTDEELAASGGVLWDPLEAMPEGGRIDAPRQLTSKRRFGLAEIEAFAEGRMADAFGAGFELARAHVRSPRMSGGRMRWFDEITDFDPQGGPWGRGYLRATAQVTGDDWFFEGHFKDDPCMPGTLMFEGTLQTMAFYLAAQGFALDKDGWRFEPVPEVPYHMRCRGQVIPSSRELVYELFVEEVHDGQYPTLWADLLVTVDGLKAFHCRRMGLRLVPGFPMEARQEMMEIVDATPVASEDGFAFGQKSLWACAWGKPSMAFGPKFAGFDAGKRLPRLPGPPYHFMSRIVELDGKIGEPRVGSAVVCEYDIPPDAWYFRENGNPTMPYAVLLEAALQPCGWLASFVGTPLRSEGELFFRNLDGTGTQHLELGPDAGTLRTEVTLKSSSKAAGMVIVGFDVRCTLGGKLVYDMETVFGFFPGKALASQVGLPPTPEEAAVIAAPSDFLVELATAGERYASPAIAPGMLRLIDRLTGWWPEGGPAGLGRVRAEKDVDPSHWYFKAHFFQDPVQPGSLGLEAMLQALQAAMIEKGLAEGIENPRFEPIAVGVPLTWKYRGQVVPSAKRVVIDLDLVEIGHDERGVWAKADGWLWVDGMRIYGATSMAMRIVSGPPAGPAPEQGPPRAEAPPLGPDDELLDPDVDTWLQDHKPTYVIPVLPFMSLLDRIAAAAAAARPDQCVVGLADVHVQKWVALPGGQLRLRRRVEPRPDGRLDVVIERWWDAPNPALSRFEPVASGVVATAERWPAAPEALRPPSDAMPQPDPYGAGDMFHGPAFHVLNTLAMGASGSSATLSAESGLPPGLLNQALLDGLTHAIPSADLARWSPEIGPDMVGYPSRVVEMTVHGETPRTGEVRCEVRFAGFHGSPPNVRFPSFEIQLITGERVWATLKLVYILFPKGPLGQVPGKLRQAFLAERAPVPTMSLSRVEGDATLLTPKEVRGSDWLPGTLARLYRTDGEVEQLTREIAAKEHVARRLGLHPGDVRLLAEGETLAAIAPDAPLTRHPLALAVAADGAVTVRDAGPAALDLAPVRNYWRRRLGMGRWPGEDLYYGLAERYVDAVRLEDAEAFARVQGRGMLFLANHQVGIESLLFSLIASALGRVPTATLAKAEHRDSWLGRLIAHHFAYPGVADPELILFFDRQDPASLPRILSNLKPLLAQGQKSLMVHADGTRSLAANHPVQQVSGALIDLALEAEVPIVPVRFVGGLPLEPAAERLEFPVDQGKQTYWLGRPILPETLRAQGLAERKKLVLEGLNRLGPAPGAEVPCAPDEAFAAEVEGWRARAGVGEIPAVMFKTLEHLAEPTSEIAALLEAVRRPEATPQPGPWLDALYRWLRGEAALLDVPDRG